MKDKDFKEMMEFIGRRFEGIDEQSKAVRTEIILAKEETMRHTGVLMEDVQRNLEILAEGIQGVNEKIARKQGDNEAEHARLERKLLINSAGISGLDQRVERLERKA